MNRIVENPNHLVAMAKKISKEEIIRNALELARQIQAAVAALGTETNPETLLNHNSFIQDQGRIQALRGVIRDRYIELFDKRRST
jgi:hypothetical protein